MPKLFTRDDYDRLLKQARKGSLAHEILVEIEIRGLVRKKPERTQRAPQEKAWQTWKRNVLPDKTSLSIHIYDRNGVIQYRYPYPFVPNKRVDTSTHVRCLEGFPKGQIEVPSKIADLDYYLRLEDPERFFTRLRKEPPPDEPGFPQIPLRPEQLSAMLLSASPKFEFFSHVEDPRTLLQVLLEVPDIHADKLFHETLAAIERRDDPALIVRMKARLLRYSPELWWSLENMLRHQAGEPVIPSRGDLVAVVMKGQREEKKRARKQNANTSLRRKG